jgi:hypothetical protein
VKKMMWVDEESLHSAMLRAPLTAKFALPILEAIYGFDLSERESDSLKSQAPHTGHAIPCSSST